MSKTAYIIRRASHRFAIVWVDDTRYQTSTPLSADMAPAHTAVERGTSDDAIRRLARHAGGARYRTLREVAEEYDMSPEAVKAARQRGRALYEQSAALTR